MTGIVKATEKNLMVFSGRAHPGLAEEVAELAAEGLSVVFISAELEEVLRLSDRLVVMRDRRKIDERLNADVSVRDVLEIIAGETRPEILAEPGPASSTEGVPHA